MANQPPGKLPTLGHCVGPASPSTVSHVIADTRGPAKDIQPKVILRADRFNAMCKVIGLRTDVQIAAAAGYTNRTIRRARKGQLGQVFIANTLAMLMNHSDELAQHGLYPTFDALFEITEQAA